jgi:hypothetical protein
MGSIGPQKSERVTRDGVFTRRRGPGEGVLTSKLVQITLAAVGNELRLCRLICGKLSKA